jgi:hypothetical protein
VRNVEIVKEPRAQRCWAAVDIVSRERVLQVHDRDLLERICRRLGWTIVEQSQEVPKHPVKSAS